MRTLHFRAMGSPCRIVVDGGDPNLANQAQSYLQQLESKWSRFQADSEISHLNRNAGNITVLSPETFLLVARAAEAQTLTEGRFNPLMLLQLIDLGYAAPWQDETPSDGHTPRRHHPASTEPIELFPEIKAVRLPNLTAFDPGGIGKGLAADLLTDFLVDRGATSTSVELGGDVRVNGTPWSGQRWHIGVGDPFDHSSDVATFTPLQGAVATSSILKRCWTSGTEQRHHLLDPSTGQPARTDLVSVTTCSSVTWWAEIAAKAVLIAGSANAVELLNAFGTPGIAIATDRTIHTTAAEMHTDGANNTEAMVTT